MAKIRDYDVQFLVRVSVQAPNISDASNKTHIAVRVTEAPRDQEPSIEVEWEATKRWDEDGNVVEQWGEDGTDIGDHDEEEGNDE